MKQQDSGEERQRPPIKITDKRKVRLEDLESTGDVSEPHHPPVDPESASSDSRGDPVDSTDPLTEAQSEAAAHLDDLKRLKAEFENYRKRIVKEQTEILERASAQIVARLLGVLDNFELAVSAAEETKDFAKMAKGVEMVFGELKEVLGAEGLSPIPAKDEYFDPNLHEAALEVPGDEGGVAVVAEVLRTGYTFKGRVLRPAMVKVTRRKGKGGDGSA